MKKSLKNWTNIYCIKIIIWLIGYDPIKFRWIGIYNLEHSESNETN